MQPSASADDKGAAPDLSLNPNGASEGPVPSPIQFVNEQSDEIFIAAEEGAEGDIAYTLLRNPVDSVNIPLSSKVGRFALYGTVAYEDEILLLKFFVFFRKLFANKEMLQANPSMNEAAI